MKNISLLTTLVIGLALSACGGDDGGGGSGKKPQATPKIVNPWEGISPEALSDQVNAQYRALSFSDGMLVSYNGGENPGDAEAVCRREQGEDGVHHEVCMNLEDEPYFIAPENFSVGIWHPLMFDRFATDLSCKSWSLDENGDEVASSVVNDCFDVLASMGGDQFNCEAGLVNGDKALRCTDDWAVVVNGDEDESKTVCRVHLSNNTGRCLGAPKAEVADANLILEMQRTTWEGYRSDQDNSEQFGVGDTATPLFPQDMPAGARLTYTSEDEAVCRVDTDDSDGGFGSVTVAPNALAPTSCRIFVRVEAEGFAERVLFVEIPILKANDLEWEDYRRSNNYFYPGERLVARAASSTDPESTDNEYVSLTSEFCSVDENTGDIHAIAPGDCLIELTGIAEGYLDRIIQKNIRVDAPRDVFVDIAWADFDALPDTFKAGDMTAALSNPPVAQKMDPDTQANIDVAAANVEISIASANDENCTWDADAKKISFINADPCVMEVSARGIADERGAAIFSKQFMITPGLGELEAVAGLAYASGAIYAGEAPALMVPTAPAGASFAYSASGGGCEVDADSGALTILAADRAADENNGIEAISCMVTATASKDGYEDKISDPITVGIAKADNVTLTAWENPYPVGTIAHDEILVLSPADMPTDGQGSLSYSATGSCTVEASIGEVTAAASGTDACVVKVKWSGDDNYAQSNEVTLATIEVSAAGNNHTDPVWDNAPYTGQKVGVTVDIANAIPVTNSGVLEYRGLSRDICTIDAASGALSGVAAGECMVGARFMGGGGKLPSDWASTTVTVAKGDHPALVSNNPYGASPKISVDEILAIVNPPEGKGAATYSISSGGCTVGEDGTVTAGSSAENCVVQVAFAGDENYEALAAADLATIVVVAEEIQTIAIDEKPYGEEPSLGIMGTLSLVNGATASAGGTISYGTGDANICTVDASTGEITGVAMGECVISVSAAAVAAADPEPAYASAGPVNFFTISVGEGDLADILTWNPERDVRFGSELILAAVDVGSTGAVVTYTIEDARESGCAFKGNSGADARTLVFADFGSCIVKASATAANYKSWEQSHFVRTLRGQIVFSGGSAGFASNASLTVGNATAVVPTAFTLNPSDADVSWELARGERDCVMTNSATGAVVALASAYDGQDNPLCSVRMVAEKEGYGTWRSEVKTVALAKGALGTISNPGFGSNGQLQSGIPLSQGRSVEMMVPPALDGAHLRIVSVAVAGEESDGTAKADVCEIDEHEDSETFGHIRVKYAQVQMDDGNGNTIPKVDDNGNPVYETVAIKGDVCAVSVTVDALGYAEKAATVKLPITGGSFGFFAAADENGIRAKLAPAPHYADALKVLRGNALLPYHATDNPKGQQAQNPVANNGDTPYLPTEAQELDANGDIATHDHDDDSSTDEVAKAAITVAWGSYYAMSLDSNGDKKEGVVCFVAGNNGGLQVGPEANVGDICRVYAIAKATGYEDYHSMAFEAVIEAGELNITGEFPKPTYGTLRPGISVEPVLPVHSIDVNHVEVSWTAWSVVGTDNDGTPADNYGVCFVDENTGVVTAGSAASMGDTCVVSAKIANANYEDSADIQLEPLTIAAQGVFADITAPVYNGDLTLRGPSIAIATEPVLSTAVEGVEWTYEVEVKDANDATPDPLRAICSIDANSGALTLESDALAGDKCHVIAIANAVGFAQKRASGSEVAPLIVRDTFTSLAWSGFPTTGTVGTSIDLSSNLPVANPADGNIAISVVSGDCTYTSTSGSEALSFSDITECVLKVTASKDNYSDISDLYRVTPMMGTITVASWGSYSGVKVGVAIAAPSLGTTVPATADKTYALASDSAGCTLNSDGSGQVTGTAAGSSNCKVELTLSATGYNEISNTYTISVGKGTQTNTALANWSNPYGANPSITFGTGGSKKAISATLPTGQGAIVYGLDSGDTSYCTINASTGEVTLLAAGAGESCQVDAKFAGNANYEESPLATNIATISTSKGTFTGVAWTGYRSGNNLNKAIVLDNTNLNANNPSSTPTATWTYSTTAASSICTVNSGTGALTISGAGNCPVKGVPSKAGYNTHNGITRTVVISKKWQPNLIPGSISYGNSPSRRVGQEAILPTGTPGNSGFGPVRYSIRNRPYNCSLNGETGAVTAKADFRSPNTCVVGAYFAGNEYYNPSQGARIASIRVERGYQGAITWSAFPASGTVGTSTSALAAPVSSPAGATFGYSASGGCTIDSSTRVISFTGVADCVIQVTASGITGYNNRSQNFTVTGVGQGTQANPTGSNVYGNSPSLAVGGTLAVVTAPSGGGAQTSLEYQSQNSTNCTVASNGTVSGVSQGRCRVRVRWAGNNNWVASGWLNLLDITVGVGTQGSITWSAFPSSATVGVSTSALAAPVSSPPGATFTYSASGGCSISNSRVISFSSNSACTITVTASQTDYTNKQGVFTVTPGAGTISIAGADATAKWGSYGSVVVDSNTNAPSLGTITPSSVNKAYSSLTTSACTVTSNGVVTGKVSGTNNCEIKLVLSKTGYNNLEYTYTISVGMGTQGAISWSAFPSSGTVGTSTAALAAPVSSPAGATFSYSASGGCSISSSRVISFSSATECVVTVTASQNGYDNRSDIFRVTPGAASQSAPAAWNAYATNLAVGAVAITPGGTPPSGKGDLQYRVLPADSNYCTVSASGSVQGRAHADIPQDCEVQARFSGNSNYSASNYATIDTVRITKGTQGAITWAAFPSSATVGVDTIALAAPVSSPAGATFTYATSGGCSISSSRVISFTGTTECVVTVTASQTGYDSKSDTFRVTPGAGTISVSSWGSYTDTPVNTQRSAPSVTSTPAFSSLTKLYRYHEHGTCVGGSIVLGTGRVSRNQAGSCTVRLILSKTGYNNVHHDYTINFTKLNQNAPSWSNAYGSSVSLAVGASAITPTGAPSGQGALSYRVKSGSESYCSVNGATGAVTALAAGVGNTCTIQAQFAGNNAYNASSYADIGSISIVAGTLSSVNWDNLDTDRHVGVNYTLPNPNGTLGTDTITITRQSGAGCGLTGGVLSFTTTADCKVRAVVARSGYTTKTIDKTISVTLRTLSFNSVPTITIDGTPDELIVGNTGPSNALTFTALPATDANSVAVAWTFSVNGYESDGITPDSNVCKVNNAGKLLIRSGAVAGDICRISVVGAASDYSDYTSVVDVDLVVQPAP